MAKREVPTQDKLHELFTYKKGALIWKIRPGANVFNSRYAGNIAGGTDGRGFRRIVIKQCGGAWLAHRLIWIYLFGPIPKDAEIDHINRIKDDNNISNLRLAKHTETCANDTIKKNNKSGFKGVCKVRYGWRADITYKGKRLHIGNFKTVEEAHEAHVKKENELKGEFSPN